VIDRLADEGLVQTCSIRGLRWGEVDFPRDLEPARAVVADV
jgi:choline kinase